MTKVLICGSINVDVIAQSQEPESNIRKSGHVQLCFGGTGHNMSINMHEMGESIGFLGAFNDGCIANLSIDNLEGRGIDCHIKTQESLDDNLFVANFHDGKLAHATASQSLTEAAFSKDELRPIFELYGSIIATTVFSEETLINMSHIAKEQNKKFFVNVNAEAQALKVANIPYMTAVFVNKREAAILENKLDVASTADAATMLETTIIASQGKSAFLYAAPNTAAITYPFKEEEVLGTTLGVNEISVTNLIRSHIHTDTFDFTVARDFIDRILNVNHGHLGASHTLKLSLQREARKAEADTLTGTLNRRGMNKFIERRSKQPGKLSVLLIDIDYFKRINDNHGHDVGDMVLQHISMQLKRFVRASDGLCRWGGEEFLVMLPDIGTTSASILAERIRKKIANTALPKLEKNISVSIGVSERMNNEPISDVIKNADLALYEAKNAGRDRVIVYNNTCPNKEIPHSANMGDVC